MAPSRRRQPPRRPRSASHRVRPRPARPLPGRRTAHRRWLELTLTRPPQKHRGHRARGRDLGRPAERRPGRRRTRCGRGPTTVLTGGPGTGKTWTVATVLRALRFERASTSRRSRCANRQGRRPYERDAGGRSRRCEASTRRRQSTGSSGRSHDLARVFATTRGTRYPTTSSSSTRRRWSDSGSWLGFSMRSHPRRVCSSSVTPTSSPREAGTVLADLVRGLGPRGDVVELTENRRSVPAIQELARAIRSGDPDAVLADSRSRSS